jgi:hypothetical protein
MLENRRDKEATKAAGFASKKSYVSFAGHQYLYGLADHARRRVEVWEQANGMCQTCKKPHKVPLHLGEWHHAQKTYGGRRCDGLCCAQWSCEAGHPKMRVKWTKNG